MSMNPTNNSPSKRGTGTTRRRFIRKTANAAVATAAVSTFSGVHAWAGTASDTIHLGVVGCGGMRKGHIQGLVEQQENVSFDWLCDVDPRQMDSASALIDGFQPAAPKRTFRYEDVALDSNVDAVIIATPHHWHAPIAIGMMQSGKDVYIEKPISHVYQEGQLIIEAARKYGRIVQQGSQMRSSPVTAKAARLLSEGIIGEVKVARAWTAEMRSVKKPVPDSEPPAGVNYDLWLGPAPKRPFNRQRFHVSWRWFRDYGNGEIGDDGIHDLDMACWGLNVDTMPKQITARGSRMQLHGHASQYPDNMNVAYEYPDGRLLIYENYPFTGYGLHGFDNGNVFYGTEGYMIFSRRGAFSVFLGNKNKRGPTEGKEIRGERGYAEHMRDFLDAVRTRQTTRASADVAHRSSALVHLGEIAYRTKGQLDFDPLAERFVDNDEANDMLTKDYRGPYGIPTVS